ncbi:CHAP domain-containing protein [Streptosporangium sp. NPDC051023]|uniref:CHAP domain-containing protein n=1 Tax=Streptosporangium sp. NPDC051023 TaxID=3155410 RepID=UPI00344DA366
MDPIGDDLLSVMEPELGYRERDGQHTTFGEWYSTKVVRDPQYKTAPWCDMFIAWAAEKAGVGDFVGRFAWTPSHARWFQAHDAWSQTPEPGALVFFDWSGGKDIEGIDHVGVVESVEAGTLHTIEGNVDGVWLRRKTRDESKVVGYGLPRKVREKLAGAVPVLDDAPQSGDRPASGPMNVTMSAPPALAFEVAPVTVTLSCALGAALVLAWLRPRVPAAGRHRRRRATRTFHLHRY